MPVDPRRMLAEGGCTQPPSGVNRCPSNVTVWFAVIDGPLRRSTSAVPDPPAARFTRSGLYVLFDQHARPLFSRVHDPHLQCPGTAGPNGSHERRRLERPREQQQPVEQGLGIEPRARVKERGVHEVVRAQVDVLHPLIGCGQRAG